jgi:hypothetical protein
VVPTSLSGVRNYSQSGHRVPPRWLIWLAVGFAVGGCVGALLATHVSDRALQWTFVGYLVILEAIVILRPPRPKVEGTADESQDVPLHWASLSAIGAIAGWSSGFLGIGGGLAITALMAGLLNLAASLASRKPRRHRAARHPPRGSALCTAGYGAAVAHDHQPHRRSLGGNGYRSALRQSRQSEQIASGADDHDRRHGDLHGVQGVALNHSSHADDGEFTACGTASKRLTTISCLVSSTRTVMSNRPS